MNPVSAVDYLQGTELLFNSGEGCVAGVPFQTAVTQLY